MATQELMGNALLAGAIVLAGGAIGAGIGDGVAGASTHRRRRTPTRSAQPALHTVLHHGEPGGGDVLH